MSVGGTANVCFSPVAAQDRRGLRFRCRRRFRCTPLPVYKLLHVRCLAGEVVAVPTVHPTIAIAPTQLGIPALLTWRRGLFTLGQKFAEANTRCLCK
jgi:hypothetical protein